ncbi:hypothetical protein CDEF62S_00478 [Castellaniella defragrans]
MGLIRALVESRVPEAVCGLVADPQAVAAAWRAGVGATLTAGWAGARAFRERALAADFVVERLHDGQVGATGAVFRGYELQLGPSACLRLGGVHIIVTSRKIQLLDLSLIRFMGFVPERQRHHRRQEHRALQGGFCTPSLHVFWCAQRQALFRWIRPSCRGGI